MLDCLLCHHRPLDEGDFCPIYREPGEKPLDSVSLCSFPGRGVSEHHQGIEGKVQKKENRFYYVAGFSFRDAGLSHGIFREHYDEGF